MISTLITTKIHYADIVTFPLNKHWDTKYLKLHKACLSFVYNKYIRTSSLSNYNHFNPSTQYLFNLSVSAFKSINTPRYPNSMRFHTKQNSRYNIRLHNTNFIEFSILDRTYASTAAQVFNKLPTEVRLSKDPNNSRNSSNSSSLNNCHHN